MSERGNVRYKDSWVTGIVYTIVTAVVAAAAVLLGIYFMMPEQLKVMTARGPLDVIITEEIHNLSRNTLLGSAVLPAAAYLWMYAGYARLAGLYPQHKREIKEGKLEGEMKEERNPWILPLILLIVLLPLWGVVSWLIVSSTNLLKLGDPSDSVMFQRFVFSYGIAMAVDILMFVIGTLFFKPDTIQGA